MSISVLGGCIISCSRALRSSTSSLSPPLSFETPHPLRGVLVPEIGPPFGLKDGKKSDRPVSVVKGRKPADEVDDLENKELFWRLF